MRLKPKYHYDLYDEIAFNCGTTADWPLDLVARDKESAQRVAAKPTQLEKALGR